MPINNTDLRAESNGNGSTTTFSIPGTFFEDSEVVVTVFDTNTNSATAATQGVDYNLSKTPVANNNSYTGNIVWIGTPPAVGKKVIRQIVPTFLQNILYPENGDFPSTAHNEGLDHAARRAQYVNYLLSRCLHMPLDKPGTFDFSMPYPLTPGRALKVSATGLGFEQSAYDPDTQQAGAAASAAAAANSANTATTQAGIATGAANTATTQAGIATGAASTATSGANTATTKAAEATSSATSAAASVVAVARSSQVAQNMYASTADGLSRGVASVNLTAAGTGGTNGTFDLGFSGGGGTGAAGVFTVAGGVVTSIVVTAKGVNYTSAPTLSFSASSGLTGATATAVIAFNNNVGEYFTVPLSADSSLLILYRVDAGPVATEIARFPSSLAINTGMPPESGWTLTVTDASNNIALGVDLQGKVFAQLRTDATVPDAALSSTVNNGIIKGAVVSALAPESGFIFGVADTGANVALGVKPNGQTWGNFSSDSTFPDRVATTASKTEIVGYGDSLTNGTGGAGTTYLTVLASALGRTTTNRGTGGQRSAAIATRQGGLPMLVTVTGDEIPASGAVTLTARSQTPITNQGPSSYVGTLAGVPGTLAASTSDGGATYTYTFTRSQAGSVVACPPDTQFFFTFSALDADKLQILWLGRNDVKTARTDHMATRDNILAAVNYLTPAVKRCLVIGITNGPAEGNPGTAYSQVVALNKELAATFGDRFIDIRRYLIDFGLADAGLTATSQDNIDIAADAIPTQLFTDGVHFTAAGYTLIGNYIARQIKARGW